MRSEAVRLGFSYTHFRRKFLQVAGLSPQRYLRAQRMLMAAATLRQTDLPIKTIAGRCGYHDVYYLTRIFPRTHHLPPGEYRRRAHMR